MSKQDIIDQLKLNTRLPVMSAPMFLVSTAEMVIESCKAGVVGCFPSPNARTIEDLERCLQDITSSLSQYEENGGRPAHWAMNMIVHNSYARFSQEEALLKIYRPKLVITALGSPSRILDTVHGYGGFVFADVNSVKHARKAAAGGADGLILICNGAGGHTGSISPFAFIEEVREFFDGPIVLSGAISNARAVKAAELLGADFAYIGTLFIASLESGASDAYRDMLVNSNVSGIIESMAVTGASANWLTKSLQKAALTVASGAKSATPAIDFSGDMHEGTKAWKHVWSAGHSVGQVRSSRPIRTIINELCEDYQKLTTQLKRRYPERE